MANTSIMNRIFNLHRVYLKVEDEESRIIIKNEIDLLMNELNQEAGISDNVKKLFKKVLEQYDVIYSTNKPSVKHEAEEKIKTLLIELKKYVKDNDNKSVHSSDNVDKDNSQ